MSGLRYVLCPTIIRSLLSTGLFLPERVAALYVCVRAGGLFSVRAGKKVGTPRRLTKARSRRSRLDVSAFSSGAAQAAVSPIGLTIGSVLGKDTGERVRFMRTGYCGGSRRIRGTRLGPPDVPKRLRHVTQLVTLLGRF